MNAKTVVVCLFIETERLVRITSGRSVCATNNYNGRIEEA